MNIVRKNYTLDYDFLLLISMALMGISLYFILQNKHPLFVHPEIVISQAKKSVSITLTKTAVVEKQTKVPPKKKVIKAKPKKVKKISPIKKKIVKTEPIPLVQKQEIVMEEESVEEEEFVQEVLKEVTQQEVVTSAQIPSQPVFDAEVKKEFIAGLYKILNQNKLYPKMAKRRHLEGIAHIQFTLLKDGRLIAVSIHKSCGHNILDKAALKLVATIEKYKPIPDSVSLAALDLNIPIKYSRE